MKRVWDWVVGVGAVTFIVELLALGISSTTRPYPEILIVGGFLIMLIDRLCNGDRKP